MKCDVAITFNLAGESFWLGQFPDSVNKPKTLSMGTYGLLRGLDRVVDALKQRNLPATFFVPAAIAENWPDSIRRLADSGFEIACGGCRGENLATLPRDEQKELLARSRKILTNLCGSAPAGFRTFMGELTAETLTILAELGFQYSSSLFGDDIPYRHSVAPLVEIPIKWQLFDFPYFAFNYHPAFPTGQGRIAGYAHTLENWKWEYDGAVRHGLSYIPQFDPQTIGTPGRIALMEELLDYTARGENSVYHTCRELAEGVS
ncbi:MAG: polysaccharide deacetylase [Synergistaceae bacterium]|jgi:peptidoglycan/xylan/chitin deacetylase (PgdA/CDA1 family)|nr:polysaccharide deacetylase [Synergistaceae bacterium]